VPQDDQGIGVLELPYIFDNLEHVHRVVDGPTGRQIFDKTLQVTGIRTIASYDEDSVSIGFWLQRRF
jgi:TRAP-type C4-dicarboxylate transport system substrate-binding protein